MLRWLIGYKMQEVIETEHQVEEPKEQAGDEHRNFHEKFVILTIVMTKYGLLLTSIPVKSL